MLVYNLKGGEFDYLSSLAHLFFFCIVYLAPINMQSIFVYLLVLFKLFVFVWAQGNNQGDIIYPTPGTVWHVGQEVNVVCF